MKTRTNRASVPRAKGTLRFEFVVRLRHGR